LNETHNNSSPDGITYRLPFQNLAYRALVRVIDFFPPQLEDFATPFNHEYATPSCSVSDDDQGDHYINLPDISLNQRGIEWEWRFCLLVEDAHRGPRGQSRDRLKLFVHGAAAVFLLKMDAME
jgi:protection of telomeres protein 1